MKLKKLLSCLLALVLTVCMSGLTTLAAETTTVVFSDSFERESETGFYVSNPVLRAYGENLINNGDFSSALITSGDGVKFTKQNATLAVENEMLKVTTTDANIAKDLAFSIEIPIDDMTAGKVYELEAYVKSASNYPMKGYLNQTHLGHSTTNSWYGVDFLHDNGNRILLSESATEWERVVARFSIETTPAESELVGTNATAVPSHYNWRFEIDWNFDGRTSATDAVYIDNIKLRQVLNATPSDSEAQSGMPVYSDANLAGKTVQAVMDVMNTTNAAKDVTLITAYYNADKSLNSILNIYKTSVSGNSAVTQRIESEAFTVPASLNGGDIQVFAWDNTGNLVPYLEKTDSEYIAYAEKTERSSDASKAINSTNILGSQKWFYEDSFANDTGYTHSSFTEEIDTATAHSGISSLCLPTADGSSGYHTSMVYTTVPVKPDTTYRLEFYALPSTQTDTFTFYVSGACGNVPNSHTYAMTGTINSPYKWEGSLTGSQATQEVIVTNKVTTSGARYYGLISGIGASTGWNKVTYTFTTPPADTAAYDDVYSDSEDGKYTAGEAGSYWTTFGTNVGIVFSHGSNSLKNSSTPKSREYAAWIDDVVLYEVTETE